MTVWKSLVFLLIVKKSCCFLEPLVQDVAVDTFSAAQDIEQRPVGGVSLNDPFQLIKETLVTQALNLVQEDYDLHRNPDEVYDFIIVGAGSSGSVLARRLSEISSWKILVIEAGKGEMLLTEVPVLAAYFQKSRYDWGHKMEPQEGVCLGMENEQCYWPRGKAVGGTTVLNYMILNRGNRIDYDRLAAAGNPGWSYEDVLPYFKKSETAKIAYREDYYHGFDGPLSVEDVPYRTPIVHKFLEGALELGHDIIDYHGKTQFGFGYVQATIRNGRRCSTAKAFLHDVKRRPNLHILTNTKATKIIIDPDSLEAIGVEFFRNGKNLKAYARKEVIISAGTYHSPQLLMLSGIGPKEHLEEMEIEVVKDLPVGQIMYDHICYPGLSFTVNTTHSSLIVKQAVQPQNVISWLGGKGQLTMIGGVEALGFIKTNKSQETEDYADIELIFIGGTMASDYGTGVSRGMSVKQEIYDAVFKPIENIDAWTAFPMLVHPNSKGYMKLRDKDPMSYPLLYGNYFTDPNNQDIDTLVEGIKYVIKISNTEAMQSIGSKINERPLPGCRNIPFGSDDYWRCCVRQLTATLHHQVATCKMGPANDPEAIVDNRLRVYGIRKLRVADSSILPKEPTAHSNGPAIMIGEKASDMIKEDWLET